MAKNKKKQTKGGRTREFNGENLSGVETRENGGDEAEEVEAEAGEKKAATDTVEMDNLGIELREKTEELELVKRELEELKILHKDGGLEVGKEVDDNGDDPQIGEGEVKELRETLQKVQIERDETRASYDNLLSKLSSMKSVFSKMKESQEELESIKEKLEEALKENEELKQKSSDAEEVITLRDLKEKLVKESAELNGECDRLSETLAQARKEFQAKEELLQDEKYTLENTNSKQAKKINELRSGIAELTTAKEEAQVENRNLNLALDDLKSIIAEKDTQIHRLKAKVSETETILGEKNAEIARLEKDHQQNMAKLQDTLDEQITKLKASEKDSEEKTQQINSLKAELSRLDELETDLNNKQLLIGKLRHEAVILNEHLTKSLTMLKQQLNNLDNTIDKDLVSNVIISFLQIPRGDTKKFEALQLISALLEWNDSQRASAGLTKTGQSRNLNGKDDDRPVRQSFVSLWTDFLEKESSK